MDEPNPSDRGGGSIGRVSPRWRPLAFDELDERQRELWTSITGGARGKTALTPGGTLVGPFDPLLRSVDIGMHVAALGEQLRYRSSLDDATREVAIITVAATLQAPYEWTVHARLARQYGVPDAVIDAIAAARAPRFDRIEQELAHVATRELLAHGRLPDELVDQVQATLGEAGLVELTTLAGFYSLISFILNVFDVPDEALDP